MKALITGGAGFIGSHLAELLIQQGHEVHVMDSLIAGSREFVPKKAGFHQLDVRDSAARDLVEQLKPDVLYHLAAQADVQTSLRKPGLDLAVNVNGTVNLLEGCRRAGRGKLVFSSTSGVYGDLQKSRLKETDPLSPISFYALSKAAAEEYIRQYNRLFDIPFTILRFANVYGPRQTAKGEGGVVAVFLSRMQAGLPLRIYGDGEQTRDFIYVEDVATAAAACAAPEAGNGHTLHVSTGVRTSVKGLAEKLCRWHGGVYPVEYGPAKSGDIKHSCLDNVRIKEILDWEPQVHLKEGLRRTRRYWGLSD